MTRLTPGDHWITELKHFEIPGGTRVRRQRFSWMIHKPDEPLTPSTRVVVRCDMRDCVNPEHLQLGVVPPAGGVQAKMDKATEEHVKTNGIKADERTLRWLIAKEEDPDMKARQEAALAALLAERAE